MLNFACGDNIIKWDNYNQEITCNKFSFEEWHKIVTDIDTEEDWKSFLVNYSDLVECYILKDVDCNDTIGFVYLYNESIPNRIVSIHGGGWEKSMRFSLLYYRGIIILIENLLNKGIKVRTSCLVDNGRALRFLKSVGFVIYRTSDTYVQMWINEKRLKNSTIYKRFREE